MSRAIKDFILAITLFRRFFIFTAWSDIRMQYRRSTLGPWWITASMAVSVGVLSIVYSRLMHESLGPYVVYVGCGSAIWYLISTSISAGASVFNSESDYITQINIPISVYVLKLLTKNLITFGHSFIVCVAIILMFAPINWHTLLFIPGMLLLLMNLYWVILLIGMLGSRYRDIPPIINSVIQLLFLASPIAWNANKLGAHSKIVLLNPITYAMDIVREPLMGHSPMLLSWIVGIVCFVIGTTISFLLLNKYRTRIPYWVG